MKEESKKLAYNAGVCNAGVFRVFSVCRILFSTRLKNEAGKFLIVKYKVFVLPF